ncbi:hypothetical protein [Pseudokineococcus sp. 1T1Z-3]|uniref:hypothetical protein n=1 Tax=Pseudokineococcus sp. 1T1Z-3 TaxID=3132745 RepID=UPI00403F94F4
MPADGVVVHVARTHLGKAGRAWELTVAFTERSGSSRESVWAGESGLDRTIYQPGMRLPVRYDPEEPAWIYLPGGGRPHPLVLPAAFFFGGGFVVVVGALFAYLYFR